MQSCARPLAQLGCPPNKGAKVGEVAAVPCGRRTTHEEMTRRLSDIAPDGALGHVQSLWGGGGCWVLAVMRLGRCL